MTEPSEASVSSSAASLGLFVPASLVLGFAVFVVLVVVRIVVIFFVVVFEIVVVFVVVGRDVELEGRQTGDFEVRPALGTTELIPLIDVELVDFDFGVTFGAGGHSDYYNHAPMASTSVSSKTIVVADDTAFV